MPLLGTGLLRTLHYIWSGSVSVSVSVSVSGSVSVGSVSVSVSGFRVMNRVRVLVYSQG